MFSVLSLQIFSTDLTIIVNDTGDTMALLLDRVSTLEVTINFQQEQIDTMQNTIDDQAATIVLLQSTDNITNERLDTVEADVEGKVKIIFMKGAITLKPPVIFHINQVLCQLDDMPT